MKRNRKSENEPVTIVIPEVAFKDLQIAMMSRELTQQRIQQAADASNKAVIDAFRAAGLDPAKRYQFDQVTRTATEVVE